MKTTSKRAKIYLPIIYVFIFMHAEMLRAEEISIKIENTLKTPEKPAQDEPAKKQTPLDGISLRPGVGWLIVDKRIGSLTDVVLKELPKVDWQHPWYSLAVDGIFQSRWELLRVDVEFSFAAWLASSLKNSDEVAFAGTVNLKLGKGFSKFSIYGEAVVGAGTDKFTDGPKGVGLASTYRAGARLPVELAQKSKIYVGIEPSIVMFTHWVAGADPLHPADKAAANTIFLFISASVAYVWH